MQSTIGKLFMVLLVAGGAVWLQSEFRDLHNRLDEMDVKLTSPLAVSAPTLAVVVPPLSPSRKLPALPAYTVEAPDILLVTFTPRSDLLPQDNQYLIRPDGTINLGKLGAVSVTVMTLPQVEEAVRAQVVKVQPDVQIHADVTAYNSKFYYVVADVNGTGEQAVRLPASGNETVLDAVSQVNGLATIGKKTVWISRHKPEGSPDLILPVDWEGITREGNTATNYQIMPGDRVFVKALPQSKSSGVVTSVERLLGTQLRR